MNGLIDDARELLQRIEAGKYIYTDDAPFNIPNSMERDCYRSTRPFAIRRYFRRSYSRTTAASPCR
jgi:hypothetical protein